MDELERLRQENAALRESLLEIQELVSWHCDTDADPNDDSPEDMGAHVNGLVWQICEKWLKQTGPA